MKNILISLVILAFSSVATGQDLDQKVSVSYRDVDLSHLLEELSVLFDIHFSYLENDLPENQKVDMIGKGEKLGVLLEGTLNEAGLHYVEYGGQVIIKPGVPDSAPENKSETPEENGDQDQENLEQEIASIYPLDITDEVKGIAAVDIDPDLLIEKEPEVMPAAMAKSNGVDLNQEQEKKPITHIFFDEDPAEEQKAYKRNGIQVGIIPPLNTHGIHGEEYINLLSFNAIAGYSAGLEGIEFSGVANIEKGNVYGAQFAGFTNIVNQSVKGVQAAGFLNIAGESVNGAQLGGFMNIAEGGVKGLQAAYFMNTSGDSSVAGQLAGFANYAKVNDGLQAAGFMNRSYGGENVQLAAFMNVNRGRQKGLQASAFLNVSEHQEGVQVGLINKARRMKGLQLGLINLSDEIDGTAIGLITWAKNGYRTLELFYDPNMQINGAFKFGVDHFYTIIYGGGQYPITVDPITTAGLGFGSKIKLNSFLHLSFDLVGASIFEPYLNSDGQLDTNPIYDLEYYNNRYMFSTTLDANLFANFYLFGGPVVNVNHSNIVNPDGRRGSIIADNFIYSNSRYRRFVGVWLGYRAGLRF